MASAMKGMAKRFAIFVVAATFVMTMSTAVQANCLAYIGESEDGSTILVLSCGSSAGAGFWECPVAGGPCTGFTSPSADFLCATGILGCGNAKLLLKKCDAIADTRESKPGKVSTALGIQVV